VREWLAGERPQGADQAHAAETLRDACGAGEGIRATAGDSDDGKALELKLIRQLRHVGRPGADRPARQEGGFTETGTIRRKQPQAEPSGGACPEAALQARARVTVKVQDRASSGIAQLEAGEGAPIRELEAVFALHRVSVRCLLTAHRHRDNLSSLDHGSNPLLWRSNLRTQRDATGIDCARFSNDPGAACLTATANTP
jgi:hypothetical protein